MADEKVPSPEVRCGNCSLPLDVNKHIVAFPQAWHANAMHLVTVSNGFVGTVHCPDCGHYTNYRIA